jgi:hypothetical protein
MPRGEKDLLPVFQVLFDELGGQGAVAANDGSAMVGRELSSHGADDVDFSTSGLEFEVKAGENEFPIQLAKPGKRRG